MPVDAGRIIIRQSDAPITVFFVLTGEVHMIKNEKNQVMADVYNYMILTLGLIEGRRSGHGLPWCWRYDG